MFIDIKKKLETDGDYRDMLCRYARLIEVIEKKPIKKDKDKQLLIDATLHVLKALDYNVGLLVGYFFPKFDKGDPMTLYDRPFSMAMFHMPIRGYVCVKGSRQIGKCLTINNLQTFKDSKTQEIRNLTAGEAFNMFKELDK